MPKTVLLTGGGTLGPVTPLLALAVEWQKIVPDIRFVWVGTPQGPERSLVERAGIPFIPFSAPKLSRHEPWKWPILPFALGRSLWHAYQLLQELKPDLIVSAGGYVSVPFAWVGFMCRVPLWIHQLDVLPLLANRLMAPFATRVSVTCPQSLAYFSSEKTFLAGSFVREELFHGDAQKFFVRFHLRSSLPTVLVMGGGTGARSLNEAIEVIREDLLEKMNLIHIVGPGKMTPVLAEPRDGYAAFELLDREMADALAATDVVVARSGMGTLMELAALGKPTILIPLPGSSFQETNAQFANEKEAAIVLHEPTPQLLAQQILHLIQERGTRAQLSAKIKNLFETNAASRIVREAEQMLSDTTHLPDRSSR